MGIVEPAWAMADELVPNQNGVFLGFVEVTIDGVMTIMERADAHAAVFMHALQGSVEGVTVKEHFLVDTCSGLRHHRLEFGMV